MSTHDPGFGSEQASAGAVGEYTLSVHEDLIAEALAAVEAREEEVRIRNAAEVDEDDEPALEFVFDDDESDDRDDEEDAVSVDLDLDLDLAGDIAGDSAGDMVQGALARELARSATALEQAQAALAAAETARNEAVLGAEESEEARRRARRSARKYRTALEREVEQRQRIGSTQKLLRDRIARVEARHEDAEAARLVAIEAIAERDADVERAHRDIARLRRREERARDDGARKAYEGMCKELLPVLDNLQMAVDAGGTEPDRVLDGVRMVLGQFVNALDRVGLSRVPSQAGSPFDPNLHEAMQMVPSDDVATGQIVAELTAGFQFDRRLLRAARVIVASGPLTPPVPHSTDPADESPVVDTPSSFQPVPAVSADGEE